MSRDVNVEAERMEAIAWSQLQGHVPTQVACDLGIEVHHWEETVGVMARHLDSISMNRIFNLGLARPLDEEKLGEIVKTYRDRGVGRVLHHLNPDIRPAGADMLLRAAGFLPGKRMTKFVRKCRAIPVVDSSVTTTVAGPSDRETFAAIVGEQVPLSLRPAVVSTFGVTNWTHFLAHHEGRAIGAAALLVDGSNAWGGLAATLPHAQGRGAQAQLLATRLHAAAKAGAECMYCESMEDTPALSSPSYRNLLRLGFSIVNHRTGYLLDLREPRQS
jgi:GNAT superfamily N-acetyltransferase